MNRYSLHKPKPKIDYTPQVGDRVKLTPAAAKYRLYGNDAKPSRELIKAIKGARGVITDDFETEWEVIWDGSVVVDYGLGFFPDKEDVELE